MNPKVTIVIPFYNCSFVHQAIQSALDQRYPSIEVVVVDDGSTTNQHLLQPYLRHIHYLGKPNGGTGSALNHGIRHSSGQYIAWLSSDDVFYPDKVANQVQFMLDQHAYISHTNYHYINAGNETTQLNVSPDFSYPMTFYQSFLDCNPVNGCTVMFRRELFSYISLFNETLKYTQDLDLWYRAILHGFQFPFLNQSLTGYRWHDAMGTRVHTEIVQQEFHHLQNHYRPSLLQLIAATRS